MIYRALIVDDEPIIRYGLASTVNWSSAGIELAGEAGNGETALSLVTERSIDILITDIKMPRMDGLELIRLSKQYRPHLKAILISSYSDFEYAREAVRLGVVVDYLLKPTMEPEDVTRLLAICRSKLDEERFLEEQSGLYMQEERARKRLGLENEMHRLLTGQPADLMVYASEWQGPYTLSVWRGDSALPGDFERHAERLAHLVPEGAVCMVGERELCLLLPDRSTEGMTATRSVSQAHKAFLEGKVDGLAAGVRFTVGISPTFHRLDRLGDAYGWAQHAFLTAFFEGTGRCYDGEIRRPGLGDEAEAALSPRPAESMAREQAASLREILSRKLADSDEAACERTLQKLFELWRTRSFSPGEIRKQAGDALLRMQSVRPYLRSEEKLEQMMSDHERLSRMGSLEEVVALMLGRFHEGRELGDAFPLASLSEDSGGAHAIQTAVAYIQEHYRTELSLREVADSVHMSRNYFSEQFKRRTGLNFIDYVIRLRIRYARHLLETTTLKVYDIGTHCGFNSAKHFLKMFKRESGCTPAEYRSRVPQGEGGGS